MDTILSYTKEKKKYEIVLVNAEKLSETRNSSRLDNEDRTPKILLMPSLPRKMMKVVYF